MKLEHKPVDRCATLRYSKGFLCSCGRTILGSDAIRDHFGKEYVTMTDIPGGAIAEIERLKLRIKSLEAGECRFHCRVRADMWKAGFNWEQTMWPGLHRATPEQVDEEYNKWRNQHEGDTRITRRDTTDDGESE